MASIHPLINSTKPNDIAVFYYSGHGTQEIDISGDETDGIDEVLVPYDVGLSDPKYITDDTLSFLIKKVSERGQHVVAIIDASYSVGIVTRGAGPPTRSWRSLPNKTLPSARISGEPRDFLLSGENYVVFLAASENTSAYDHSPSEEGGTYGAFTYFLAQILSHAKHPLSYREVSYLISANLRANYYLQEPLLEGSAIDNYVFTNTAGEPLQDYFEPRLRIGFIDKSASQALRRISRELGQSNSFQEVTAYEKAELRLREADRQILIEVSDPIHVSQSFPLSDPNANKLVIDRVYRWAKWFAVYSIKNPLPKVEIELVVNAASDSHSVRKPNLSTGRNPRVTEVYEGELVECVIKNMSNQKLHVSIIHLSSDGTIAVLSDALTLVQDGDTLSTMLHTFILGGHDSEQDIIKIFATSSRVDFNLLTPEAVRYRPRLGNFRGDPLEVLLSRSISSTFRSLHPISPGDWVTAQRSIVVKRH